jgi:hypothetical protein
VISKGTNSGSSTVEAAVLEKLGLIGLAECMDEKRNPGLLWMWLEACSFHR